MITPNSEKIMKEYELKNNTMKDSESTKNLDQENYYRVLKKVLTKSSEISITENWVVHIGRFITKTITNHFALIYLEVMKIKIYFNKYQKESLWIFEVQHINSKLCCP